MTHAPRTLAAAYLGALAPFVLLDACWLGVMGPRLYQPALGHLMAAQVDWLAAVLFYPLYLCGLVYFAVLPALPARQPRLALLRGALFGFITYATYDLTNQATLRGWPWVVTLADMAWGTVLNAAAAWVAAWLTCRASSRTPGQ